MRYFFGIALILVSVVGCKQPEVKPLDVVRPVKIIEVTADGRSGKAEYPGRVAIANEVELSFGVEGKLTELLVKEGDRVKKGQVLARLDAEQFKAQLSLTRAKERAALSDFDRHKELLAANAATAQQLDFAKRNYEVAVARTRLSRKDVKDTVLKAPFAGIIAKTVVDNFQSVLAKQPVMLLQDLNKEGFEVKIDIPERDVAGAEKGLTLEQRTEQMSPKVIITSSPDVEIPAYLKEVVTVADPKTRTFEVTFGFSPTDEVNAIPGMTARVLVVWPAPKGEGNKILIPAQAIIPGKQEGQARVWVIDTGTMTAKGTDVTVGQLTGDEVEVQSGLAPGVSIAISGVQQLREGMKVRRYRLKDY